MSQKYYSNRQLAKYLGISLSWIQKADAAELPPRMKVGGQYRYPVDAVESFYADKVERQQQLVPGGAYV